MAREVNLDIRSVPFDGGGVKDFYWPLEHTAGIPCRDSFLDTAVSILRRPEFADDPVAEAARVYFKWFAARVIGIFETTALVRRFREAGRTLVWPPHYQRMAALWSGTKLEGTLFTQLAAGPARGLRAPRMLKALVREVQWNGTAGTVRALRDGDGVPVGVHPSSLGLRHAAWSNTVLRYAHPTDWFGPIDRERLRAACAATARAPVIGELLDAAAAALAAAGETAPTVMLEHLAEWLGQAAGFCALHKERIASGSRPLPSVLWAASAGSGGWITLLSHEVRRRGGKTIGHDHGYGSAFYEEVGAHFVEYNHCSTFCTYNAAQAEIRRRRIQPHLLWNGEAPTVVSLDDCRQAAVRPAAAAREITINRPIRTLMYVGTAFQGEAARFRPILPDLVRLDWEARLLSFIKSLGIIAIYKPHPEGRSRPPENFGEAFGFRTIHTRFEQIDEPVDAYLTDFIYSSVKGPLLKSELPVIFLNQGHPAILPEPMTLLERRCDVIPIWSDEFNRFQTDWDRLGSVLTRSRHRFTMEFPDLYFANT